MGALIFSAGFFAGDLLAPVWVLLAATLLTPVEKGIQESFKRAARRRLSARTDLDIIAITGSYGKTSVKHAVSEVLNHRFSVLSTPGSFNTPMGICRVINDQLTDAYRILVLEMGIRKEGDIAELCGIARPDIALVTSVGVAHLESMGTVEAIAREKGSLLSFVRPDGHAVLNADDEQVRRMGWDFEGTAWMVSTEGNPEACIQATDIHYGPEGARFLVTDETGESILMTTKLLGRHNITNVLMAVAVGRIYGLRLRQIKQAVSRLTPVPHRLAVRKDGAITIIDDAFNSNPVGARNAVEILGQMDTGRRFIVTPGMIELGALEESENLAFGKAIARNTDVAILVGERRTAAIAEGLRSENFPSDQIWIVRSLFEAKDLLKESLTDGDTVLFENDLPDQFNEA
jgi:UDP-N-acetylmuramoyl-tripeptide--D-alanyl-D-alanine ligase